MIDYSKVNKWMAEKCGFDINIPFYVDGHPELGWIPKGVLCRWDIRDPRCRELFRNWWISQNPSTRKVLIHAHGVTYLEGWDGGITTKGIDEIACIVTIWESEK